jgi:hypothetical protein
MAYIHRIKLNLKVNGQTDTWPISKETLKRKHFKIFAQFINEIRFDKLNEVTNTPSQGS